MLHTVQTKTVSKQKDRHHIGCICCAAIPVSFYSQRVQHRYPSERSAIVQSRFSRALTAIGIFLFFGAVMASLAGTTLLWRGTILERMWALNPTAYKKLEPWGAAAGVLFLLLGVALSVAGAGWFKRRLGMEAGGGHHRYAGRG